MYRVSIRNMVTGQWQTTTETSLAKATQLVMGLCTSWYINHNSQNVYSGKFQGMSNPDLYKRYKHAQRSLVAAWMKRFQARGTVKTIGQCNDYRFSLRLCDSALKRYNRVLVAYNSIFGEMK